MGDVGRPRLPGLPAHPRHARRQPAVVPEPDVGQRQRQRQRRRAVADARVAVQHRRSAVRAGGRRLRLFSAGGRRQQRRASRSTVSPAAAAVRPSPVRPLLAQHRGVHRGGIRVAGRRRRLLT